MNRANTKFCFYCKKEAIDDKNNFKHKMWFVTDRTIIPASIKFKEQEVPIQRCRNCYEKHHKSYMKVIWLVLIVGFFLLYRFKVGTWPTETAHVVFAYFLCGVGALASVGLIITIWEYLFFKMINKIPRESDVLTHPLVVAFEDLGWLSSKPDPKSAEIGKPKGK
ncbi:MAG: hypothetical protein ACI8ZM_003549 [Crocinitomix sp.]|jgi:hypothetical protein